MFDTFILKADANMVFSGVSLNELTTGSFIGGVCACACVYVHACVLFNDH